MAKKTRFIFATVSSQPRTTFICLLRTALFARVLHCAHSLARSLAHSGVHGKANWTSSRYSFSHAPITVLSSCIFCALFLAHFLRLLHSFSFIIHWFGVRLSIVGQLKLSPNCFSPSLSYYFFFFLPIFWGSDACALMVSSLRTISLSASADILNFPPPPLFWKLLQKKKKRIKKKWWEGDDQNILNCPPPPFSKKVAAVHVGGRRQGKGGEERKKKRRGKCREREVGVRRKGVRKGRGKGGFN